MINFLLRQLRGQEENSTKRYERQKKTSGEWELFKLSRNNLSKAKGLNSKKR